MTEFWVENDSSRFTSGCHTIRFHEVWNLPKIRFNDREFEKFYQTLKKYRKGLK